ncbi:MAG: alpha/beta fold hydrolase [Verrucomicrobia bacterium]|nr:alpha/beta fold hydrolase [Verrucomicrobiota bacterium]
MRQIDFQARWNESNSHLQADIFTRMAGTLFAPITSLCRQLIMPTTGFPRELVERVDQIWQNKWEGDADLARTSPLGADPTRLRTHYEPIVLNLTTPDGINIKGTLYRHRRGASMDIPTILCCQPNGQLARDSGWDWLLKKGCASPQPFHVITFDYRQCGASRGTLHRLKDLVIDADTVYQAAKDSLNISERNLHHLGFSMGGAVSAMLADKHPLSGRCTNLNSFDCLENVIKNSPMIGDVIARFPIPAFLASCSGFIRSFIGPIIAWLGWGLDARGALERIKQRTLFMYHPQDPLIPPAAAAVNAASLTPLQAATQVVQLQFKPTIRCEYPGFNHHAGPLMLYQDASGLNASKRIVNFILGRDLFAQRRAERDRRHMVIDRDGSMRITR